MPAKTSIGVIALSLGLAVGLFGGGWLAHEFLAGDFKTISLAGGRQVLVLRDLKNVFPIYGKSAKAELDLALSQKQQILKTTAGGKYESDVKQLYAALDAINSDVRSALISAYSGLLVKISVTADPSTAEAAFAQWDKVQELVIKEAFSLRAINQQLSAAKTLTSGEEWHELVSLGDRALQGAALLKQEGAKLRAGTTGRRST